MSSIVHPIASPIRPNRLPRIIPVNHPLPLRYVMIPVTIAKAICVKKKSFIILSFKCYLKIAISSAVELHTKLFYECRGNIV